MLCLDNGIKVIHNPNFQHIWISFSDFGFESDHTSIIGLSHLLEHVIINPDYDNFIFNGYTSRTGMVLWCKGKDHLSNPAWEACGELLSWLFYPDGRLRTTFENLDAYFEEIENEYYFRKTNYNMEDPVYGLQGMDLIACGRQQDFQGKDLLIKKMIRKRLLEISSSQITIFISNLDSEILKSLNQTFGQIQRTTHPMIYPGFIVPKQSHPSQNIVLLSSKSPYYKVCIRIQRDPILVNTVGAYSIHETNMDLQYFSGDPWCCFYYKTEQECKSLLRSLQQKKLWPLYVKAKYHKRILDSVALLYAKSSQVQWDHFTDPDDSQIDLDLLIEELHHSSQVYGNVLIQAPNIDSFITLKDSKSHTMGIWPVYMHLDQDVNHILETWKKESFEDVKMMFLNHNHNFIELDHVQTVSNSEIMECGCFSECMNKVETKKKNNFCPVLVLHSSMNTDLARICAFLGQNSLPFRVLDRKICLNENGLRALNQGETLMSELKIGFFRILLELYFRLDQGLDPESILKALPQTQAPEFSMIQDQDNIHIDLEPKPWNPVPGKGHTWLIKTPFSFVSGFLILDKDSKSGVNPEKILWSIKKSGQSYEMHYSQHKNNIYFFSHSINPVKTELEYKNILKEAFGSMTLYFILGLKDQTFDLGPLEKK